MELREEELPPPEAWDVAVERAGKVFGIAVSPLRNASNASEFAAKVGEAAGEQAADCSKLVTRLATIGTELSIAENDARRLRTARATSALVEGLGTRCAARRGSRGSRPSSPTLLSKRWGPAFTR